MKSLFHYICIMIVLVLVFALGCLWQEAMHEVVQDKPIPTFSEIQIILVESGYDIGKAGVDGKIGRDTLAAWDRAICDQYAALYFVKGGK